jgi:ribosome biogenesis GTPase
VQQISTVDPVAIGDFVELLEAGDGTGMITAVLPRRTQLSRRAAGPKPLEQVIAANVDQIVAVMAAAQPEPKWNVLDRYLADAEFASLPAVICVTKMDLASDDQVRLELSLYESIGYRAVLTSAVSGRGLDQIAKVFQGHVSVFVGKSGVGKSTLLNALQPDLNLPVNEVGRSGKGRHTTVSLELIRLRLGGGVIDTPGMREFGLWNVSAADLARCFPEMRPHIGQCRFGSDCSHSHEPGCAIKTAVEAGLIAPRRYRSYLRMMS